MSNVYERLGVPTIINAKGTATRVSGAPMPPEVAAAMQEATQHCVDMAQLQGRASEIIADATGAEAGMVTAGASAGLLLGTAACLAGLDPARMNRLPDTTGMRDEAVVVRSQRNFYDHAVRAAGAHLVEVGLADRFSGAGVRDAEAWEINDAIGERTACAFYVAQPSSRPSLAAVAEVAHAKSVPVLVDAASQLPPTRNTERLPSRTVHGRDDSPVTAKATRGLGRDGAAVLDFAPPRVPVSEHFCVHVDDDVVAIRGKGRSASRFEHALGQPREHIGAAHGAGGTARARPTWDAGGSVLVLPSRGRLLFGVRVHRRIKRAQDPRAHLRGEPTVHDHGAVILVPERERALSVPGVGALGLFGPPGLAIQAHELLDMLGRPMQADLEEVGFVPGGRDAGQGADLGVAELAPGHGLGEQGGAREGRGRRGLSRGRCGGRCRTPRGAGRFYCVHRVYTIPAQ